MTTAERNTERVLIIDQNSDRSSILEQTLSSQGYEVVCRLQSTEGLINRVEQLAPDIIIIELNSPDQFVLEHMASLHSHIPRPVVMFAEEGDSETIGQAIKAGVSAYVVDGMSADRIQPIMSAAAARFHELQALRIELDDVKGELQDRKQLDQAKRLIMKHQNCNEEQAYSAMRKMAMDNGQAMTSVAKNIISVLKMLD
ncbi:ANTAR domain-containing response regulator [Amphritea balenae]|uniref:ANTAR domain-containing protein n=1 Tax=Amphritea balenae TaxID=452629 RepID=A0A3P1SXQ8_9GAMM|nr:ANTAR domain-containing protein [Amphritea balenae]RRD01336.1 ANTAR domain-containing protein [Amphritea balenae]GGK57987.1 histidine kinase [Amphritea balenae]